MLDYAAMTVVLTHITALECLRSLHFDREGTAPFARPRPERIAPPSKTQADMLELRHPGLTEPLHCGIEKESLRAGKRPDLKCHFLQKNLLSSSFLYLEEGVYISSPELCFLQMASLLSVEELILVGFELCGTYALSLDARCKARDREHAIASRGSMEKFLARIGRHPGKEKAQRALRYVRDGSASPMESALAMLLGLPSSLGGYGLGMPKLNWRVDTAKERADRLQTSFRKCDLFWPPNLTVEYESAQEHSGREALERDAIRRNDLFGKRVYTMSVTPRQVYNVRMLDMRAKQIASFLKKQVRPRAKGYEAKKRYLREVVLPKVLPR